MDVVGIEYAFLVSTMSFKIQMSVTAFPKIAVTFATRSVLLNGQGFSVVIESLAMVTRIAQYHIKMIILAHIVKAVNDAVVGHDKLISVQKKEAWLVLESGNASPVGACHHITLWVKLHVEHHSTVKGSQLPILHVGKRGMEDAAIHTRIVPFADIHVALLVGNHIANGMVLVADKTHVGCVPSGTSIEGVKQLSFAPQQQSVVVDGVCTKHIVVGCRV